MNIKRFFWAGIWLLIILIGAISAVYIPLKWHYIFGFAIGCFASTAFELSKDK